MKSTRKNSNKDSKFNIPGYTRNIISYWSKCLDKSAELEVIQDDSSGSWIKIDQSISNINHLPTEYFDKLIAQSGNNKKHSSNKFNKKNVVDVVISPLRFRDPAAKRNREIKNILLIPAKLTQSGELFQSPDSPPWIPREFLEPLLVDDKNPTISSIYRVEKFFKSKPLKNFKTFDMFWEYCLKFLSFCSKQKFDSFALEDFEPVPGIFIRNFDKNLSPIAGLLRIMEEVRAGYRNPGLLPKICLPKKLNRRLYPNSKYSLYKTAKNHLAHISPDFNLSQSQRSAVHRYLQTPENEVFCVNGPPGTGKTTVLQSFILTTWALSALKQDKYPPVCLVCGATNQSVMNVVDAFENDMSDDSIMARRWIPGVHSYGSFLVSFSKSDEAGNYQIENTNGNGFSDEMEDELFIQNTEKFFLSQYNKVFKPVDTIEKALKFLHSTLKKEADSLDRAIISTLRIMPWDLISRFFSRLSFSELQFSARSLEPFDQSIRYRMHMLTTHYWEARWILETRLELKRRKERNDLKTRFRPTTRDWRRRSMITPVLVSTISMASRFFGVRETRNEPPVDVLFFDEAGQINPELGGPLSILARKMVVIGDTAQLRPYTNLPPHIDEIKMLDARLIKSKENNGFKQLIKSGMSASSSNLMQLAVRSCKQDDGNVIGASLEEHRRSVPEIISYCNDLSYNGRLKPVREPLKNRIIKPFEFKQSNGKSVSVGQSRKNREEATMISEYIHSLSSELLDYYSKESLDEVLAILTPFTAQVVEIEKQIKRIYPDLIIGTVHSLQGAERPVIIFSSVYDDSYKGNYVFDRDPRILNVAVSRAKDSFVVFGSEHVFKPENKSALTPSSLLGKYLSL